MKIIRRKCDFTYGVKVRADSTKCSICLVWKDEVVITLFKFYFNYIYVSIQKSGEDVEWHFTGFYGSSIANGRADS